jgi:hypothetical protein
LADATVVHNNPSLLQPDLTLKRSEWAKNYLRQLLSQERPQIMENS